MEDLFNRQSDSNRTISNTWNLRIEKIFKFEMHYVKSATSILFSGSPT